MMGKKISSFNVGYIQIVQKTISKSNIINNSIGCHAKKYFHNVHSSLAEEKKNVLSKGSKGNGEIKNSALSFRRQLQELFDNPEAGASDFLSGRSLSMKEVSQEIRKQGLSEVNPSVSRTTNNNNNNNNISSININNTNNKNNLNNTKIQGFNFSLDGNSFKSNNNNSNNNNNNNNLSKNINNSKIEFMRAEHGWRKPNRHYLRYRMYANFSSNNSKITITTPVQYKEDFQILQDAMNTFNSTNDAQIFASSKVSDARIRILQPVEEVVTSFSIGMAGYKNAKRGIYEYAYEALLQFFNKVVNDMKLLDMPYTLVIRGYGQGRMAFMEAIGAATSTPLRNLIDSAGTYTKLPFGGNRPMKKRRI